MSAISPEAYATLQRRLFKLLDRLLLENSRVLKKEKPHVAMVVFTVLGRIYAEDFAEMVDHPEARRWIDDLYAKARKEIREATAGEDH